MARRLSCLSWQEAGCLFILFYFKSLVMVWKNREKIQEIILYAIMKGNSSVIRELKYMSSHYWPISHLCSLSFDGVNREREGEGGREREHARIWLKNNQKATLSLVLFCLAHCWPIISVPSCPECLENSLRHWKDRDSGKQKDLTNQI